MFCREVDGKLKVVSIDLDYCKGCGVCVEECPRSAMTLEETDYETGS